MGKSVPGVTSGCATSVLDCQAACQIVPRAQQPGRHEELLPVGEFTAPVCGPERNTAPLPPCAIIGLQTEAQRGKATGPRSHSGQAAERGHRIILEPVMISVAGQCHVGRSPRGNGQFVPTPPCHRAGVEDAAFSLSRRLFSRKPAAEPGSWDSRVGGGWTWPPGVNSLAFLSFL